MLDCVRGVVVFVTAHFKGLQKQKLVLFSHFCENAQVNHGLCTIKHVAVMSSFMKISQSIVSKIYKYSCAILITSLVAIK